MKADRHPLLSINNWAIAVITPLMAGAGSFESLMLCANAEPRKKKTHHIPLTIALKHHKG